ncbi:Hypothetical protein GSB_155337 [Giardia duodenalis]|uniref:Uncharacterized protein n=1 Tax=Giardia intestinalis TaxID=5741 RepID=V6TSP5_GIAIN|nr:Hypothetical protein GSB_155337 [Giardia intestinalis]
MHPSDIFNSNDFPPLEPAADSRPSSRKCASSRERVPAKPAAPASPAFKSLCGAVGRLLARIAAECAAGTDNYDRVAEWFSKWLHSLGITVRFVRRQPNEYVGTNHYTGFCTRIADNVRSAFFIYEDVGTELVNRMRSAKCRQLYKPDMPCISDDDAGRLAEFIRAFLDSSQEMFTFDRFMAALSPVQ